MSGVWISGNDDGGRQSAGGTENYGAGGELSEKKLANANVTLIVYTNEIVEDQVNIKKQEGIVLASGEALGGNGIIWYPEHFARLEGDPVLQLSVTNSRGETIARSMELANPQILDFWQVGVLPEAGLKCRIVLGNGNKYTSTEEISLL